MNKIILFGICLLFWLPLLSTEPESKIDFRTVSHRLNAEVMPILQSSGGDLYFLDTSNLAKIFFSPHITVDGRLVYGIEVMVFSKKFPLCSTYEALELHRRIIEDLLPKLNALRTLRPYLAEFPLTPHSFHLDICFSGPPGKHFLPPYFTSLLIRSIPWDPTIYLILNQSKGCGKRVDSCDVVRIPYEKVPGLAPFFEARVKRGPGPKNSWLLVNTFPSNGPMEEQIVFQFVPEFCPQNNLHFITTGSVENRELATCSFGFVFAGTQKFLLEDTRKLAAKCGIQFLHRIQESEEAKECVIKWNKMMKKPNPEAPPSSRDFAFRLSFWDDNLDRRENPYIAEVHMFNSTFQYFTSDEGQRLVLVYEEPFDDAVKFFKDGEKK